MYKMGFITYEQQEFMNVGIYDIFPANTFIFSLRYLILGNVSMYPVYNPNNDTGIS